MSYDNYIQHFIWRIAIPVIYRAIETCDVNHFCNDYMYHCMCTDVYTSITIPIYNSLITTRACNYYWASLRYMHGWIFNTSFHMIPILQHTYMHNWTERPVYSIFSRTKVESKINAQSLPPMNIPCDSHLWSMSMQVHRLSSSPTWTVWMVNTDLSWLGPVTAACMVSSNRGRIYWPSCSYEWQIGPA